MVYVHLLGQQAVGNNFKKLLYSLSRNKIYEAMQGRYKIKSPSLNNNCITSSK